MTSTQAKITIEITIEDPHMTLDQLSSSETICQIESSVGRDLSNYMWQLGAYKDLRVAEVSLSYTERFN
jgi:hypothetical protein